MTRSIGNEDEWDVRRQNLWDNAVQRATVSPRGQKVLREIEAALLALPEHRLIEGFRCDGTGVCVVGALAAHRRVLGGSSWEEAFSALDESDDYDVEAGDCPSVNETAYYAEGQLRMAFALAWDLAYDNDHRHEGLTPEERYERVLHWVRRRIVERASGATW